MDMLITTKVLARMVFPVPLVLELLGAGLFCLWFMRWKRSGATLVGAGLALLLFFSLPGLVSPLLVAPLEKEYPPMDVSSQAATDPKWIVVLGGGNDSSPERPLSGHLTRSSLRRLMEGLAQLGRLPRARLLVSGGVVDGWEGDGPVMARLAEELGIPSERIVVDAASRNTRAQARMIAATVGDAPFVLVTSAMHMPRAMLECSALGLAALPAPTDYLGVLPEDGFLTRWVPSAGGLVLSESAMNEYLGMAWFLVRR